MFLQRSIVKFDIEWYRLKKNCNNVFLSSFKHQLAGSLAKMFALKATEIRVIPRNPVQTISDSIFQARLVQNLLVVSSFPVSCSRTKRRNVFAFARTSCLCFNLKNRCSVVLPLLLSFSVTPNQHQADNSKQQQTNHKSRNPNRGQRAVEGGCLYKQNGASHQ